MPSLLFRKTLLALAITATAIPAYGHTIWDTSKLFQIADGSSLPISSDMESLEVLGIANPKSDLLEYGLNGVTVQKNMTISATIHSKNGFNVGFKFRESLDGNRSNAVHGNLLHTGSLSVIGMGDLSALMLSETEIGGNLTNEGFLNSQGSGNGNASALNISEQSTVNGDVINTQDGLLRADNNVSHALSVTKSKLGGKIINQGQIEAIGADSTAIIIGSGVTTSSGAALQIQNSGTLSAGVNAIDASAATGLPVELQLEGGSVVTGNLLNLSKVDVLGNVLFTGTDQGNAPHIKLAKGAVNVGNGSTAGHLQLGLDHTLLEGDLALASGSSLTLKPTDPSQISFTIAGNAVFEKGSQIKLDTQASKHEFTTSGARFKLLQANHLDDKGLSVSLGDRSPLLHAKANVDASNHAVTAQIALKSEREIAELVGNRGATPNSQEALVRLAHDGVLSRLEDDDAIFQVFSTADEQQLAELSKQLTPEVNGGASQAATTGQTLVSNTTSNRTSGLRGLSSGEAFKQTGVWVQSLYSDATQSQRKGVEGYKANSSGLSVGADGKINDQLTLGVAYSYLNTDVKSQGRNTTQVDGHAFTLYGGYEHGNYFVDASLTAGMNNNQGKRHIAGTTAKSTYDSTLLGLDVTGGYTYTVNDQLLLEPRLAARYSLVDIDGFSEKGSSASLKVKEQRFTAFEVGAGLRVAANYPLGKGTLVPQAKLMFYQDIMSDDTSTTSTYVQGNTPFVTTGAKSARSSYEAGVGADYKLGAVTLGLNYDHVGKSGFDADTFTAKVRYDF